MPKFGDDQTSNSNIYLVKTSAAKQNNLAWVARVGCMLGGSKLHCYFFAICGPKYSWLCDHFMEIL